MLPLFLKEYFWEVRFEELDPERSAQYIIARILEYGDLDAVRWLLKTYPRSTVIAVLQKSRALSVRSANFWAMYFNVPRESVLCLTKHFRETSRAIWKR